MNTFKYPTIASLIHSNREDIDQILKHSDRNNLVLVDLLKSPRLQNIKFVNRNCDDYQIPLALCHIKIFAKQKVK